MADDDRQPASARQLRLMFDHSPVGAVLVSPEGRFLRANAAFCRFVGYSEAELQDLSFADITHAEHRERDVEQVGRLITGELVRYETDKRYLHKSGAVVWGRASVALLRDDDARPMYFLTIIQDITERIQVEEALRESEERYRTAFLTMPDAININRASDGLFVDVNDGFTSLSGWTAAEVAGKTSVEIGIWANPTDRQRLVDVLVRDGVCNNLEAVFRRKDGGTAIGLMSARLVRYRGVPCILSVTRDISDRKRAEAERQRMEQQLLQTQKLESLGVLAGGIAHDFNNILMAVLGHAELALDDLPPASPARSNLVGIATAARRAADLCRQMLAYSGRASFSVEAVHLRELVDEMIHLLKTSISKRVVLNVQLDRDLPTIKADPSQLRQVVMNLILNASEAIGDRDGAIALSASEVDCDDLYLRATELATDLKPGRYVRLDVTDTGCGMTADTRARIFEPFFTTKFSGRGLGLAAVLGIVRAHRGAIKVASEPGRGTTFSVLFPAVPGGGSAEAPDGQAVAAAWRGEGTILLADDEASLRALGARMLERLGFEVVTASDGREAVEIYAARRGEISVVILDLTMPYLNGAEAFATLLRMDPGVRVILASGYAHEDVAARFAGTGLAGVLQKPYALAQVRQVLAGLVPSR
jgi:two-component system, cell cycle sensor histidine kinase and response regulator CckA